MKPSAHMKEHVHIQIGRSQVGGVKLEDVGGPERAPPFQAHIVINNPQLGEAGDGIKKKRDILQLPADLLPGRPSISELRCINPFNTK